jgi:uncharacterized protein YhhL (DUF1145 family)
MSATDFFRLAMRSSKPAALLLYGAALAAQAGLWTGSAAVIVRNVAAVMLLAHAIETVVAFRYVRRYRGALAVSIVLALLFGLLHILPLARQSSRH